MSSKQSPKHESSVQNPTRRTVVKTAAYVVPAVLTLSVSPSFAQTASGPTEPPG
mgnify:CR=1 FL=1